MSPHGDIIKVARQPRSAKSAERLAAALRSGALTGRAHARKGPPAMFGMSLSAPAGQPFQGGNPRPARNFLASVRLNKTAFYLAWLHRDARAGYGEQFPLKVRLPSCTNRQCVLAQKDKSVGITLTPLRHSQGLVSPSDFQRNWKADRYGILGQLHSQSGFFNWLRSPRQRGPMDSPTPSQSRSQPHPY
jgi:hypothetical protein